MPLLVGEGREGGRVRVNIGVIAQSIWGEVGGCGRGFGGEYLRLAVLEISCLLWLCSDAYWKSYPRKMTSDMTQFITTEYNNNNVTGVVRGRGIIW